MQKIRLLPYDTIRSASQGDALAMERVLAQFDSYINKLSSHVMYCTNGNACFVIDEDMKRLLQIRLITAVLKFRAE